MIDLHMSSYHTVVAWTTINCMLSMDWHKVSNAVVIALNLHSVLQSQFNIPEACHL